MIGFVVAGVASGVGKTTLTLGLIGALRRRGLTVQPFKVGPDYIDPSHHAQAAGRPSRNLDSWLLPEWALRELFVRAAAPANVAIVEGVMGLFDGRSGAGEIGSTAHVAKILGLPVVLVADAAKAGRSVAAAVVGCRAMDPALRIVGVVLNNVAGERHAELGREAVESAAGLPVLGWLPREPALRQEERYLGLVPAAERQLASDVLERAAALVESRVDLGNLARLAEGSGRAEQTDPGGLFPSEPIPTRVRIAVARDEAFSFYYQDSLDLLAAWGAELVPFSPLRDTALPDGVGGVYIGGGFPELFAAGLASNTRMLDSVRAAAGRGLPIYAECGGLMYIQDALIDREGRRHPMAGIIPGASSLAGSRLTLGYREVRARRCTPLLATGETVRGHEFHWSVSEPPPAELAAYDLLGQGEPRVEGYAAGSVLASYVHLHFGSDPSLAPRLVEACAGVTRRPPSLPLTRRSVSAGDGEPVRPLSSRVPRPSPLAPGSHLRAHGLPPAEIEALSRRRIEERAGHLLPADEPARGLVARLVYAAGDPGLARQVEMSGDFIDATVAALRRAAPVVVDVGMAAAGVSRAALAALGCDLVVTLDADGAERVVAEHGVTRSAAGVLALEDRLHGAVVAIGNAPTALLALLDLAEAGIARPAAVIGVPVGFVAAEESKELLAASGLPYLTIRGTRGGSALAAAAANHLLRLAADRSFAPPDPRAEAIR